MTEDTSFETLLSLVGGEGAWQRRLLARCSLAALLTGLHSLAAVVQAATPAHRCALPDQLQTFGLAPDDYVPSVTSPAGRHLQLSCRMFNLSVAADGTLANGTGLLPCQHFDFDLEAYGQTTTVAWQLVCERAPLAAVAQSCFMMAMLAGFLLSGLLGDMFGRRVVARWYALLTPLASLAVAAAPTLEAFIVLRALLGLLLPGLFSCLIVLCLETVDPTARSVYGILFQVPVDLGLVLAAAAAFATSSWWQLQLVLSVPALLLPFVLRDLPESPRWLLSRGRLLEAAHVLETMAARNGRPPPSHQELLRLLGVCYRSERAALLGGSSAPEKQRRCCATASSDLVQLFATPRMRLISLGCLWCLFVDGLASYGISEDAAQLGSNAYTALALSGAVGLLANAASVMMSGRLGRRLTVVAAQLVTALACLTLLAVPETADWAQLALAMGARGAATAGLNVLAFYSAELFPTTLRSTGFSVGATASRLGAVVAPLLVTEASRAHWGAPTAVFGASTLAAGVAALRLPETRGKRLPETVQDVEADW